MTLSPAACDRAIEDTRTGERPEADRPWEHPMAWSQYAAWPGSDAEAFDAEYCGDHALQFVRDLMDVPAFRNHADTKRLAEQLAGFLSGDIPASAFNDTIVVYAAFPAIRAMGEACNRFSVAWDEARQRHMRKLIEDGEASL